MAEEQAPRNLAREVERMTCELSNTAVLLEHAYLSERLTRKRLLRIHGLKAMGAGWLMWQFGTAYVLEDRIGLWMRPLMAITGTVAGLLLLAVQMLPRRHFRAELVGVFLVGLWDMLMVAGFAITLASEVDQWPSWNSFALTLKPQSQQTVLPYPLVVYGSLMLMLWTVHLPAVWKDRKRGRQ